MTREEKVIEDARLAEEMAKKTSEGMIDENGNLIADTPDAQQELVPEKTPETTTPNEHPGQQEPVKEVERKEPDKDLLIESLRRALDKYKSNSRSEAAKISALQLEINRLKAEVEKLNLANHSVEESKSFSNLKENFGEDAAKDIQAQIKEGVAATLKTLGIEKGQAKQPDQSGASEKSNTVLSEENFAIFTGLVPNFQQIYGNPEFRNYLSKREKKSGLTNYDLLYGATVDQDPFRVAEIYQDFEGSAASAKTPEKQASREDNVTPSGKGGKGNQTGSQKPIYARKEIDAAYAEYRRRVSDMSDEQRVKFQKLFEDINLAISEGRIVP